MPTGLKCWEASKCAAWKGDALRCYLTGLTSLLIGPNELCCCWGWATAAGMYELTKFVVPEL